MAGGDEPYRELARRTSELLPHGRPVLLGVTGGVAAGKTTTAEKLRHLLEAEGHRVDVLGTDAFLLPNAVLDERSLAMRKGFPESFDTPALDACLRTLGAGGTVEIPVYSHETYDRVPGEGRVLGGSDVVVIEGVNALQPPVVDHLDLSVYVDADEADLQAWFLERFVALCELATPGDGTFYGGLASLPRASRLRIARTAWDEINAVNLRDHIAPSAARATYVLRKGRDHTVHELAAR
jgi:type I pantothenate kinase